MAAGAQVDGVDTADVMIGSFEYGCYAGSCLSPGLLFFFLSSRRNNNPRAVYNHGFCGLCRFGPAADMGLVYFPLPSVCRDVLHMSR